MSFFTKKIGIDLGTTTTLVFLPGKGVVLFEPSVVAVSEEDNRIMAIGLEAKQMIGRTPEHLIAVRPLVDGVVSDFEATEEMLSYLMNRAQGVSKKSLGPRAVIGVPSGITNVRAKVPGISASSISKMSPGPRR